MISQTQKQRWSEENGRFSDSSACVACWYCVNRCGGMGQSERPKSMSLPRTYISFSVKADALHTVAYQKAISIMHTRKNGQFLYDRGLIDSKLYIY